ncbi:MAG: DUF2254 domain-containing protein [Synoicihabitans sp.]
MRVPLTNLIERLRSRQWVIPSILSLGAAFLSVVAVRADSWFAQVIPELPWFVFSGTTDAARQLLGILSASLVSLTTISLSVTMIVLTLASNQFGPRVLRIFLRDHFNQLVIGTFVAALLFCLLLLGQLPAEGSAPAPRIAMTLAVLFSVACLFALLGFVQHTARSIQTPCVIKETSTQLDACIRQIYPSSVGQDEPTTNEVEEPPFEQNDATVHATSCGYLQAIDLDSAMSWAMTHDTTLKIIPKPGDFIVTHSPLISPRDQPDDLDDFRHTAESWFLLGEERTDEQDSRYGFQQLAEIAVRALSPGTNDPFTAVNAIDHITCALVTLAQKKSVSGFRHDEEGALRIISPRETFVEIATETFAPLCDYGTDHPVVLRALSRLLSSVETATDREEDKAWVKRSREHLTRLVEQLPASISRDLLTP